ncbi:C-X-C chemokine receptor type 3-like [Xiphias gladius]|uniref:C-X-C chemokine receptor type 3-like n=1 Tax=Xiphias gladius TaxID=8245 RepID=UPI001A99A5A3|nr:C-X-C chemokine receptor type 3-like [Xiphias gladius]
MDVELGGFLNQNSTYDYNEDYMYNEEGSEAVLIPVLYSVMLVVGLLGNVLLLAVLAQKRRSWSASDTFILHLAVADILLLVTLPLWALLAAQHYGWRFGGFLCKISGAVFNINFYCGMFLLVCISLDCCLSVVHTTQPYIHLKPALAHFSCLLVWLLSLLFTIPDWIFLMAGEDAKQEKTLCIHNYSQSGALWQLLSRLLHHTLGFLLPAVTLIFCWSCILLRLQRRSKRLQKQRAIMVILPLAVVFFLCWTPYNITLIVDTYRNSSKEPHKGSSGNPEGSLETALMVTSAMGCLHACLRPPVYLILCGNFRKRTLGFLRCATDESTGSLWELGVGEKALPDQSQEGEELKQITSVEHQVHPTQC